MSFTASMSRFMENIAAGLPRRQTFRQTSEKNDMALFSASIDVKAFSFRLFRKPRDFKGVQRLPDTRVWVLA
jgi:hypothetical protein